MHAETQATEECASICPTLIRPIRTLTWTSIGIRHSWWTVNVPVGIFTARAQTGISIRQATRIWWNTDACIDTGFGRVSPSVRYSLVKTVRTLTWTSIGIQVCWWWSIVSTGIGTATTKTSISVVIRTDVRWVCSACINTCFSWVFLRQMSWGRYKQLSIST
jgi:hypothetical protein